jgi:hypothetical protein
VTILVADLDVDSDNNEADGGPAHDAAEDSIEENAPGKFLLVNHGDDDRDGVPDYADLEIAGARHFVPLRLELRPGALWSLATVTFAYPGDAALPPPGDFAGDDVGNGYRNYATRVQDNHGPLRIWRDCTPSSARTDVNYVIPGHTYTAADLGFSDTSREQTFWIEAIRPMPPTEIRVAFVHPPGAGTTDKVVVTAVAPDLGVNCNNADFADGDGLRTGVPDVDFVIDDKDEPIEDQKDGLLFWPSRDSPQGEDPEDPADDGRVSPLGATDLLPFTVTAPPELVSAGFTFYLDQVGGSGVFAYENASGADRIGYLKNMGTLTGQLAMPAIPVPGSPADPVLLSTAPAGTTEYLVKATGGDPLYLRLWAEAPGGGGKVLADQVKLSFREVKEYYPMYSLRSGPSASPVSYPIEDGRTQEMCVYGPATKVSGPDTDTYREYFLLYVHGYNVSQNAAYTEIGEVYRRTFWAGYRGNFVGITWEGDEGVGFNPFAANVGNAFQTAMALRDFIRDQIRTAKGTALEKTFFMAHSLGCQVAMDAMRLYQVSNPAQKLVQTLTLVEPAFWSETCWPKAPVPYSATDPITYDVASLRQHSWAFFFNQPGSGSADSLGTLVNSYNPDDYALWAMMIDEHFIRNRGLHYDRLAATADRTAHANTPTSPPSSGSRNLAHQIPALLKLTGRKQDYTVHDLERPQGQQPMGGASNIDAAGKGFLPYSHNGHKGGMDKDIGSIVNETDMSFLEAIFGVWGEGWGPLPGGGLVTGDPFVTPLAQIWEWYSSELVGKGSYERAVER